MNVGINARFLIKDRLEGIGWYTHEVVSRMVRSNPSVNFFLYFDRDPGESFSFGPNATHKVLRPAARHPFLWYTWFEFLLPFAAKKDNIDVLFSPDSYTSLRFPKKKVTVIHDLGFEHFPEHVPGLAGRYYRHFTPKYAKSSDHIIAVSKATKDDIVSRYNVSPEKVSIGYNGLRGGFNPASVEKVQEVRKVWSNNRPYFLFVGALHPRKNPARLLEAFDIFCKKNKEVDLVIAGRKLWMNSSLEETYSNMSAKNRVVFTGYLDKTQLIDVTSSAHACIYPSLFEGFGVPLLEAMASGIPIVTSNLSCMPEVVADAGLLVNPYDTNDIAKAMIRVSDDLDLRKTLIRAGLDRSRAFSWDKTSEAISDKVLS